MLMIQNVEKSFAQKKVLANISLSLKQGEACGLLGGNGAGKSTLIKSLMGLLAIDAGLIEVEGRLSYLPEQPYLPENMTAWQLLHFACEMQQCEATDVALLLQEVQLDKHAWHKKIAGYSKGMKQRTAIAYALVGSPEWLILDEPMSGLDAMGRIMILDIFKKRHEQGTGILMCSHIVTDMVRLCDAVYIVAEGEAKEKLDIKSNSIEQAIFLEQQLRNWSEHEALA